MSNAYCGAGVAECLKFVLDEAFDLFQDRDGAPVIPVSSVDELAGITDICRLHGITPSRLERSDVEVGSAPARTSGVVLSIGSEASCAGRLYAHLTGRAWLPVQSLSDWDEDAPLAAVVALSERLDDGLMRRLYVEPRDTRDSVPGLIVSADAAGLVRAAKRWAMALSCAGAAGGAGRTQLFPFLTIAELVREDGRTLGGLASGQQVRDALGGGASVLAISSHANGLDIRLGRALRLCPFAGAPTPQGANRPLCLETGTCTELPPTDDRESLWRAGALASFRELKARVLVLYACDVMGVGRTGLAPRYSLPQALSQIPAIGACATTWRFEMGDPAQPRSTLATLLNDLAAGLPIGQAVATFNRSDHAKAFDVNLCLLGDPDYRPPPQPELADLPEPAQSPRAAPEGPRPGGRAELTQLVMRRTLLKTVARRFPVRPFGRDEELAGLFERLEGALLAGHDTPRLGMTRRRANEGFAGFLTSWPFLDQLLDPYFIFRGVRTGLICPCGAPARAHDYGLRLDPSEEWSVQRCNACSSVWCAPRNMPPLIEPMAQGEGLALRMAAPENARATVTFLKPGFHAPGHQTRIQTLPAIAWPLGEDEELAEQLQLSAPLPEQASRCHVAIVWDTAIAIWGTALPLPGRGQGDEFNREGA